MFIALGALDAWPGWVGLAITIVSWAGLLVLAAVSRRSGLVVRHRADRRRSASTRPTSSRTPAGATRSSRSCSTTGSVERIKNLAVRRRRPAQHARRLPAARRRVDGEAGAGAVPDPRRRVGHRRQEPAGPAADAAPRRRRAGSASRSTTGSARRPRGPSISSTASGRSRWVREHIAEYGGDPDLICVTGGSAGGHLAAMTALTANEPRYQPDFEDADTSVTACVPFYGVYDFLGLCASGDDRPRDAPARSKWVMKADPDEDPAAFEDASPIHHVRADAPPFFVIHGSQRQPRARRARPAASSRRCAQVSDEPVLYAEVPGASHAFDVFYSTRTGTADQRGRPLPRVDRRPRAAGDTGPSTGGRRPRRRARAGPRREGRGVTPDPSRGHRRRITRTLNGIDRSDDQRAYGATRKPASVTSGTS